MALSERPAQQPDILQSTIQQDHRLGIAMKSEAGIHSYITGQITKEHPSRAGEVFTGIVDTVGLSIMRASEQGFLPRDLAKLRDASHVSEANLLLLAESLFGPGPRVIIMRHGTQLSDIESKIDMMRPGRNEREPLTHWSVAQATATAFALATIAEASGKRIRVVSSENKRALQTAAIIAGIAGGELITDFRLNCVNYSPEEEVSNDEIMELLGRENNGALVWDREIVDRVIGEGTYGRITSDMAGVVSKGLLQDENMITVVVTHTQQTNAADIFAKDEPLRLRDLGMRVFAQSESGQLQSALLSNGIFVQ